MIRKENKIKMRDVEKEKKTEETVKDEEEEETEEEVGGEKEGLKYKYKKDG